MITGYSQQVLKTSFSLSYKFSIYGLSEYRNIFLTVLADNVYDIFNNVSSKRIYKTTSNVFNFNPTKESWFRVQFGTFLLEHNMVIGRFDKFFLKNLGYIRYNFAEQMLCGLYAYSSERFHYINILPNIVIDTNTNTKLSLIFNQTTLNNFGVNRDAISAFNFLQKPRYSTYPVLYNQQLLKKGNEYNISFMKDANLHFSNRLGTAEFIDFFLNFKKNTSVNIIKNGILYCEEKKSNMTFEEYLGSKNHVINNNQLGLTIKQFSKDPFIAAYYDSLTNSEKQHLALHLLELQSPGILEKIYYYYRYDTFKKTGDLFLKECCDNIFDKL